LSLTVLAAGLAVAGGARAQDPLLQAEPIPSHPVRTVTVSGPCLDRACQARAHMELAQEACAPLIEGLSEGDFEWIYRPSGGVFDRFDWPDETGTAIRYKGDRIRFQTPSGSWARMRYECGYDVARGQALFARAERGRGRQGPGRASVAEEPRIEAAPVQSAATVAPDTAPAVVPEEASEPRRAAPTPQRAVRATPAKSVKSARAAVKRTAKKARAAPARAKKKTVARKSKAKPRAVKRTAAKKARKSR
jgi:hypothetical protein